VMALWFTVVWARKVYRRQGGDRQSVFVTSEVSYSQYHQSTANTAPRKTHYPF